MTKSELAILIDSYADAKSSGNKYLIKKMIEELEEALNEIFINQESAPSFPQEVE